MEKTSIEEEALAATLNLRRKYSNASPPVGVISEDFFRCQVIPVPSSKIRPSRSFKSVLNLTSLKFLCECNPYAQFLVIMSSEQPPPYDEIMEQLKELQENITPEMKDEAYKAMAEKAASSKDEIIKEIQIGATKTEAYIRDFTQIIIPILLEPDSEYDDNLMDLNAFINRRNPISPDTQDDDFDKLRADVAAFTASFVTWADDVGAQLTEEIASLMDATESLKTELAQ
ncbi:hypothetical protein M422DRAFT_46233 [Sphaerobolus stellatus SS14]|uniref:Uncharacterized protein n=1 Tax=Sphaerobolus stellatus (strain SS14) TaxID=990650 RepID=A0A0C9UTI1_SPHS4|nr:hypothetical protein M422DRAFT_46233 [Sphaerobolus stellatus SS14]